MTALKPRTKRAVIVERSKTFAYEKVNDSIAPAIIVDSLDWLPRSGLDLDAGIRLRTPAQAPVPRPYPHVIGAISGFMPQVDLWRMGSKKARDVPGPYIGQAKGFATTAAPGTEGYLPNWYPDLIKQF